MEAIDGDVHFFPLAERLEPVEDAALVGELEVLQEPEIEVEAHQLVPEMKRWILRCHQGSFKKVGHLSCL